MPDITAFYSADECPWEGYLTSIRARDGIASYATRNLSNNYVAIDESMWQNNVYYPLYRTYIRTVDFEAVIGELQSLLKNVETSFAHSSIRGNARSILMNAIIQFKTLEFDQEAASHE